MDEDEALAKYGLTPVESDQLAEIREILRIETGKERGSQGDGDTLLMRVCCVQLFNAGLLEDVARIWAAKSASWDSAFSIDVQLLCGAGLEQTKAFLEAQEDPAARAALARVRECEACGDFDQFTPEQWSRFQAAYYLGST